MKKNVSAAVALPTVVAIALGGLLMAAPASAAPAPVEQSEGGAVPVEETAPAADPTPTAEPEPAADQPEAVVDEAEAPAAPEDVPAPAPAPAVDETSADAVEAEAEAAFEVASPVEGQVLSSAGVRVAGTAPAGSQVEISSTGDTGVVVPVVDGAFDEPVSLPAQATAASNVITVRVVGADGADLGTVQRTVVVAGLPTSAAPVISTPVDGSAVEGVPFESGDLETGVVDLAGTGTPGASIEVGLDAVDPVVAWGYGYDPVVVGADGAWADWVFMPYGTWRISVSQSAQDADGFATALSSRAVSVVVDVLRPRAAAAAAPVVTSPGQGSTVVGRPDRSQGAGASSLEFTITGTGTPGSAIAIYGYFEEGRAPIDRYAAAARGEGGGEGEFEPLVAGTAPVVVAADGTWSFTQTLAGPGTYSFAAFALTGDRYFPTMSAPSEVVTFTLAAPAAGTATATTASLAFTGDDGVGSALAGGVLAIGLGAAALTVVRRRAQRVSGAAAGSARRA
jgi:hypothetical protein